MKQIDLEDLPPRIASILSDLAQGETLGLVSHGLVVARLQVQPGAPPAQAAELSDLTPEERMKEILGHFDSMIHDEF